MASESVLNLAATLKATDGRYQLLVNVDLTLESFMRLDLAKDFSVQPVSLRPPFDTDTLQCLQFLI